MESTKIPILRAESCIRVNIEIKYFIPMLTYTYMICPRSQLEVILKHGEGKIDEILNCDFTSTFTADGLYK